MLPKAVYLPVDRFDVRHLEVKIPGCPFSAIVCFSREVDAFDTIRRLGYMDWEVRQVMFDEARWVAQERGTPIGGVAIVLESGPPIFHFVA